MRVTKYSMRKKACMFQITSGWGLEACEIKVTGKKSQVRLGYVKCDLGQVRLGKDKSG